MAEQRDNLFLILYPFLVSTEEDFAILSKLHNTLSFMNEHDLAKECTNAIKLIRSVQTSSYQALNLLSRWALEKAILSQNPKFRLQQIDFTDSVYVSWLEQALRYFKRDEAADILIRNYQTIDSDWFLSLRNWSVASILPASFNFRSKQTETQTFGLGL